MSQTELVFYDIPGRTPETKAWSPNTWKIRFALNYKGIPYRTEWVEYPDIASVSKRIGAKPTWTNPDGTPLYTCPFIYDPSTQTVLSDSAAIADYLDRTYPTTPLLFPGTTVEDRLRVRVTHNALATGINETFGDDWWNLLALRVCLNLTERSAEYFRRTREEREGKRLEELVVEGTEEAEKTWEEIEKRFKRAGNWFVFDVDLEQVDSDGSASAVGASLAQGSTGKREKPFLGGDEVCYADFFLAGKLMWGKVALGEESKEWKRISGFGGGRWGKYLKQFEKYQTVV